MGVVDRYLKSLDEIEDNFERRVAIVGSSIVLPRAQTLIEAAFLLGEARSTGMCVVGGPSEIEAFRGGISVPELEPRRRHWMRGLRAPRLAPLRRAKIAARWNGWRLPLAIASPLATAVSVSPLLLKAARAPGARVNFHHPESLVCEAMRRGAPDRSDDLQPLVDRLSAALSREPKLQPTESRILRELMSREVIILTAVAQQLRALQEVRGIPDQVWSGSAGNYLNRVIGVEAMRRGGEAVRFSHAGLFDLQYRNPQETAIVELAASSRYVLPSQKLGVVAQNHGGLDRVTGFRRPKIVAMDGDPVIAQLRTGRRSSVRHRPRVMYVMAMMLGFRQAPTPTAPPDVVYLDWQFRLLERLEELPIEILCKPHPEGIRPGRTHPLVQSYPFTDRPFEAVMDWADIFLFDMFGSSTFYVAACTDRKIALANLVPEPLSPSFAEIYKRRCAWIDVHYTEVGLPQFDDAQLTEAVSDAGPLPDPTEFQDLYLDRPQTGAVREVAYGAQHGP